MGEIKFSIVTVCRNAVGHIERCLRSVAEQDYPHFEHVVIDGASTDGTQAVGERYTTKRPGAFVSEPDAGIYDAMNKGLRQASGDYILFLGADDYLADNSVLSDAAKYVAHHQVPEFVYGNIEVRRVNGERSVFRPPPPADALEFMICGCLPHQATFAHKRLFERIGAFDTRYRIHGDYDWFLRALTAGGLTIEYMDRIVSSFALGGSSSRLEDGQHEVFAIQEALPLYREPEWMARRLRAFQQSALRYRVRAEAVEHSAPAAETEAPDAAASTDGAAEPLPVHFFTIVLNGEPFIRYHYHMMRQLPFRWRWHIVEGVADLVHDTAWSVAGGGRIDASLHDAGRSNDGTSAYLDELAATDPEHVTIYRKPAGQFWNGKKEMVSAPLASITERSLLWQVDSDELWTSKQVEVIRDAFAREPRRSAAYFWCHYFVGPEALISTRYNYAQNPKQDWLRVWRYQPGDSWAAHEPPTLTRVMRGKQIDIARITPFTQDETEALGAVFQHYAYVAAEQLRFKEIYYGYTGAVEQWRGLQAAVAANGPVLLRDHFAWVNDNTLADALSRLGVSPLAQPDEKGRWQFQTSKDTPPPSEAGARDLSVVIDGVFFQHNQKSGIARVWRSLLEEWRKSDFAQRIIVLDRAGTAPRLSGIRYRSIPAWDEAQTGTDSLMLQRICDELGADLFVSSYYTAPISTPSVFVAHDMIPELLGANQSQIWREKGHAIAHSSRFICVSQSTRNDLLRLHPEVAEDMVSVIHNGVDPSFEPASANEVSAFRASHRLNQPYLLVVGERLGVKGYKSGEFLFTALQRWRRRSAFDIVCVGGATQIERELQNASRDLTVRRFDLTDAELRAAYTGAAALVYPSRLEGFGLPVLEAMACGCPVVTARASSLPEVGGEAALYFWPDDEAGLLAALEQAVAPGDRAEIAEAGQKQVRRFSSPGPAYASALLGTARAARAKELAAPSPLWRRLREEQRANQLETLRAAKAARAPVDQSAVALRPMLFAVRGALLRVLPSWATPLPRRAWRAIMGIRA